MVVVPVGVILSIFLADYDQISVMNALATTVAITLLMILHRNNPNWTFAKIVI